MRERSIVYPVNDTDLKTNVFWKASEDPTLSVDIPMGFMVLQKQIFSHSVIYLVFAYNYLLVGHFEAFLFFLSLHTVNITGILNICCHITTMDDNTF